MGEIGKTLITLGVILIVLGVFLSSFEKVGLGRLPGDIFIKKDNFIFYFPLATSLILSIILSLILTLIFKNH